MMLKFDEFVELVKNKITEYLDAAALYDVRIQNMVKNNDNALTGLTILKKGSIIAPVIYLEPFYENYKKGKDLESVLFEIAGMYKNNSELAISNVRELVNFAENKDKIIYRIINAERNRKNLANKPHRFMEDLAITYHISLTEDGTMSIPVTNQLLDEFGVSEDELYSLASENTSRRFPTVITSMADMLHSLMSEVDYLDAKQITEMIETINAESQMYIVTNSINMYGAAAILDRKTIESVKEKIGSSFYVIPSSMHEVILVPKSYDGTYQDIETMIRDINLTCVSSEDYLSDHVYEMDMNTMMLVRCDKVEKYKELKKQQDYQKQQEEQRIGPKLKL